MVTQVREMQKDLGVRPAELETVNKEAEEEKQQSTKVSQLVDEQTKEITIRKADVKMVLEGVETLA